MKAAIKPKRVFISPARESVNKTIFKHPVFHDVADYLSWAVSEQWPDVEALNLSGTSLLHAYTGKPLVFTKQSAELLDDGMHYEQRIFQRGLIATRENNWHDLFNAMMWLKYPKIKSALNARQWADIEGHGLKTRTPVPSSQCPKQCWHAGGSMTGMDCLSSTLISGGKAAPVSQYLAMLCLITR